MQQLSSWPRSQTVRVPPGTRPIERIERIDPAFIAESAPNACGDPAQSYSHLYIHSSMRSMRGGLFPVVEQGCAHRQSCINERCAATRRIKPVFLVSWPIGSKHVRDTIYIYIYIYMLYIHTCIHIHILILAVFSYRSSCTLYAAFAYRLNP